MKTRYAHPLLTVLASMAGLLQRGFTLATLFMAVCIYGNAQTLTELYKPYPYQGMPYRLMEPANCDSAKRYPVIVSLHGAGGRGEDNEKNLVKWAPQLTDPKVRSDYPAYVIFPQSKGMWNEQHLQNIKDIIKVLPSVDMSRIYIMGQSMGGYGTYKMIGWDPEYFAAAAPVSGSGQGSASVIKDVPIWAFHGDADPRVPIKPDRNLFDEMKRIGGKMKFTSWPGEGHSTGGMFVPFVDNGITQVSSERCDPEPVFMKWLFAQRKFVIPTVKPTQPRQ